MKAVIPLFLSLLVLVVPAHAETMYVTDEIPVMVRHEPGANRKIVAMPNTGTRVEVLENKEDGWSMVRLPDGKEGWTLTRYLTKGPSKQVIIDRLERENKALKEKSKTLLEENPHLKTERDELQKALSEQTRTAQTKCAMQNENRRLAPARATSRCPRRNGAYRVPPNQN